MKLESLNIKLADGKTLTLTIEEARALHQQLAALFAVNQALPQYPLDKRSPLREWLEKNPPGPALQPTFNPYTIFCGGAVAD